MFTGEITGRIRHGEGKLLRTIGGSVTDFVEATKEEDEGPQDKKARRN
jgi:hypothetical protein